MRLSALLVGLQLVVCACGPGSGGRPDGGIDFVSPPAYFGLVKFRCYEYVEGEQSKSNLDLGIVSFKVSTQDCPSLPKTPAGTPPEVHIVRYYTTGNVLTD